MTQITTLHATSVSYDGHGVLIVGPSGAGKSALALQLIALGAVLIADDRTCVSVQKGNLIATAPPAIEGLIEARGVGLIKSPPAGPTQLSLALDLEKTEPDRLPHPHEFTVSGVTLPCLWAVPAPHFASAVLLYLRGGVCASK